MARLEKKHFKHVFDDILLKANIPLDVYSNVIVPYLVVPCEKCKNYLTDQEWDRLTKAKLDGQYRRCDDCLVRCTGIVGPYRKPCDWIGLEYELIGDLCINHYVLKCAKESDEGTNFIIPQVCVDCRRTVKESERYWNNDFRCEECDKELLKKYSYNCFSCNLFVRSRNDDRIAEHLSKLCARCYYLLNVDNSKKRKWSIF